MKRRQLLRMAATFLFLPRRWTRRRTARRDRVRPGDPSWPSPRQWDQLAERVGGRLIEVQSPLNACREGPRSPACAEAAKGLKNPYYLQDEPALTQTTGWVGAWTSQPSVYAVAAQETSDVVAAVRFAREHRLRLVIKGGGHSYQGRSNAADSLLVWTKRLNAITLHDAFVGQGCEDLVAPSPAVTIGAGAIWRDAYEAVMTRAGRYVQGGGCLTVGVAGLVQSGGFGSFSKRFGLVAGSLLEAEVVTADGTVRIANPASNPDLFWGIKGGGGGSLGVVTRVTLKTHEPPEHLGFVSGRVRASSDDGFRALVARAVDFYADRLFDPHWGEQLRFGPGNTLGIAMSMQGLSRADVEAIWQPFLTALETSPLEYSWETPFRIDTVSPRRLWDTAFLREHAPNDIVVDDRPGAPTHNILWAADSGQVGQTIYNYRSVWLPESLLQADAREGFVAALFESTRHWNMALHFNKGLAGAPSEERAAAADTAMNPTVLDAFALAICAGEGPPSAPGVRGLEPDFTTARRIAGAVDRAMDALLTVCPDSSCYMVQSDFFEARWRDAFWGTNYRRLARVKQEYDPEGLFFIHHGVGSQQWSKDGFTRIDEEPR